MKKPPPSWLVKTLFVVLLPLFAPCIFVAIVARELWSALISIYLEIRVEIDSAREQWRNLS